MEWNGGMVGDPKAESGKRKAEKERQCEDCGGVYSSSLKYGLLCVVGTPMYGKTISFFYKNNC